MTNPTVALKQYLSNIVMAGDVDFLSEAVRTLSQMLMELEVEQNTGTAKHQRTPAHQNRRNGYRDRLWETRFV